MSKIHNYKYLNEKVKDLIRQGRIKDIEELAKLYQDSKGKTARYSGNLNKMLKGEIPLPSMFAKWFANKFDYDLNMVMNEGEYKEEKSSGRYYEKRRNKKLNESDFVEVPVFSDGLVKATPDNSATSDVMNHPTELRLMPRNLFADAQAVLPVHGNSMTPSYPPGSEVALVRDNKNFFEYGEVYVIEVHGSDIPMLKRVYESEKEGYVTLYSDNTMVQETGPRKGKYFYPPLDVKIEEIRAKWSVIGDQKRRKNQVILHK